MITAQQRECNNTSIPTIDIRVHKIMLKTLVDLGGRFMICAWDLPGSLLLLPV